MELKIGEARDFSFDSRKFIIKDIILQPNFQMIWTWDTGVCPHCKKRLTQRRNMTFTKIEILLPEGVEVEQCKKLDVMLLGDTTEGKTMMITEDKYDEVLSKSEVFKFLVNKEQS